MTQIYFYEHIKSLKWFKKKWIVNSQLLTNLQCNSSVIALLHYILHTPAKVIKLRTCHFSANSPMASCHAPNIPNWFLPQDFYNCSFLCLEHSFPGFWRLASSFIQVSAQVLFLIILCNIPTTLFLSTVLIAPWNVCLFSLCLLY